jgi:transposase
MGRKSVSIEKKAEIAALLKVSLNHSDIARRLNVSRKCVANIAEKIKNGEALANRIGQGRRRSTTNSDDRLLTIMTKRDRTQPLKVLAAKWIEAIGKTVSKDTVSRRLRSNGLNSYVQKKKPFRNRIRVRTRRLWCNRMQLWNADQWARVIRSDESHFELVNRVNRTFVRRTAKEKDCAFNFRPRLQGGGGSVSVWGCFTASGPGPILFYEGRLNRFRYVTLMGAVLPQLVDDLSSDQDGDWYFQQDNAPCHRADYTMQWFDQQEIRVLPWPPTSPDLNPIENVWSIIDRELAKVKIGSVAQLKEEIKRIWYEISDQTWADLSKSVSGRVITILRQKGRSCSQY